MFKKLKQKIAEESDGDLSPARPRSQHENEAKVCDNHFLKLFLNARIAHMFSFISVQYFSVIFVCLSILILCG